MWPAGRYLRYSAVSQWFEIGLPWHWTFGGEGVLDLFLTEVEAEEGMKWFTCDIMIRRMTQPLFLGGLIRYFSPGSDISHSTAFLYAVSIFVCSFVTVLVKQAYLLAMFHIGMKMRVAVCSLVYRKASMGCSAALTILSLASLEFRV